MRPHSIVRCPNCLKERQVGYSGANAIKTGLTSGHCKKCAHQLRTANKEERHYKWKGDNVGYRALHHWIEKKLGKPDTCEHCKKSDLKGHSIHWATKSGKYTKDLSDWIRLCASCHKKYDKLQGFNFMKKHYA